MPPALKTCLVPAAQPALVLGWTLARDLGLGLFFVLCKDT